MPGTTSETLGALLRRVDEVRGLTRQLAAVEPVDGADADAMLAVVSELVEELERSHRRLIETNIQLVSLREVASTMVMARDGGETTRLVTRYLATAFGFEDAFLLLLDRERGTLAGTWTVRRDGREHSHALELPLVGERGAVGRALWLDRALLLRDPERHPALVLPPGHALEDALTGLGSLACAPLRRSQSMLPTGATHELCGARCILGDAAVLAPPPGAAAETWAADREDRQRHCLDCELMPILGVLGIARPAGASPLAASDVALLESIALSLAPVVENARLTQDLRQSERFRLHVLDSMASALVAVDMAGAVITFNHAAEELTGYRADEARGRPFGDLFGTDAEVRVHATLEQGREALREETVLRARDGSPVPVSFTTSLLRNERRAVYGAIATFIDLTPLKQAEERARAQDRLAALGRFTSSVAHEIRNPLTGIAAGVQYLARGVPPGDADREHLDFILNEIARLDRIVQDLFDITHPRGLQRRAAPLEDAARRALQSLEAHLAERAVRVRIAVVPQTPPVPHDADGLQQVFINLIKNAAEASPRGAEVVVHIGPARPATDGIRPQPAPTVVASVQDRGSGIDPAHLATLFEPFFTTKPGGTGLGLYICHDIVRRHGGALTVDSTPARGTTFHVEMPLDADGGTS